MKSILFLLMLFIVSFNSSAQSFKTSLNFGYGMYQLNSLKELQQLILTSAELSNVEAVQQFPSYFNYGITLNYLINNRNSVGVTFTHYSTGGRNTVSDYSGKYFLNMALQGNKFVINYTFDMEKKFKLKPYLRLEAGCIFSGFNVTESLQIYPDFKSEDSYDFNSFSFVSLPALGINYPFYKSLSLDLSAGYEVNFESEIKRDKSPDQILKNSKGESVMLNWSGLRINMGASFNF